MTIVDISFEPNAFPCRLTGNATEPCGMSYAFRASLEGGASAKAASFATFSLTFRLERDISESPYFMHLIHYEYFERRIA
jgi:hypothetical protein